MAWGKPVEKPVLTKPEMPGNITVPQRLDKVEKIMLYGKGKTGKTWAACSLIEEEVARNPNVVIHYVCTDDGFKDTFYYYFGNRADALLKSNIRLYTPNQFRLNPMPFFNQVAEMFEGIRNQARPNDWLVVDLADKFWNWAQDEWIVQSAPQNSPTTYIVDAAKEIKKFMEFSRSQWQFTKRLDNYATADILDKPPCNLLYIFGEKELEVSEIDDPNKEKEANDMFALVGCRPSGQGTLPYAFSTLVYLNGMATKKFIVLGDRGYSLSYKEEAYERNWYNAFMKQRKR